MAGHPLQTRMIDYEKELNDRQLEAVRHVEGPLLILAGAGSGKTRVLIYRLAHLLQDHGVPARNVLAVTFTNKAADEMRHRVDTILGREGIPTEGLTVGTFHAVCLRLLRRYGDRLGLTPNFLVYDEDDQERALRHALERLDLSTETNPTRFFQSRIQRLKDRGLGPDGVRGDDFFAERLRNVFRVYEEQLKASGALDFGDLLVKALHLLRDHEDVLQACRDRWRFVEVDEYQDTNRVQFEFLRLLAGENGNLCVVGDDDQSIYRWRGAELKNILEFEKHFAPCRVVKLEQNYRSTQRILDAASAVVRRNAGRKGKELWTENRAGDSLTLLVAENEAEEADLVCTEIRRLARKGVRASEVAIFYRTNAQSRVFEETLTQWEIDYQVVGSLRFYERKEVKDILGFLRWCVNPGDRVSFVRLVEAVPWGIGNATVARLDGIRDERQGDYYQALEAFEGNGQAGRLRSAAARLREFLGRMREERERLGPTGFPDLATFVIKESGYLDVLAAHHKEDAETRRENLRQLVTGMTDHVARRPESTLEDYLSHVTLMTRADDFADGIEKATLMTLHCAKGLEFRVVFVAGLEEELFPLIRRDGDPPDIEEERRLFYVGMTRAKERLYLSFARTRQLFGRTRYKNPSRFLAELPQGLVEVRRTDR
ncbi:MAG: UvrD-helicase domain-containing protein [Nitrospirae bacterium]|nr:UvrD-helicase domain-containing protein [Nitrospirota bacterium]